jgi:hypothetical protein
MNAVISFTWVPLNVSTSSAFATLVRQHLVAGHVTGGLSVGVAEVEQVAATHDGHPALP